MPDPGGPENDFTNHNTTFMTWDLLHLARMLKDAGGIPAHGNQRRSGTRAAASTSATPTTGCAAQPNHRQRRAVGVGLVRPGWRSRTDGRTLDQRPQAQEGQPASVASLVPSPSFQ